MTALAADTALNQLVSDPGIRASLEAYARRRGLAEEAEDVVQAALCAAVAAPNVPADPNALPRWVHGILRRKVADVFRQRRRWPSVELPEIAAQPRAFEAREVLRRIDGELTEPRQRHALGWLLREHAGETLIEIARQEAVSPENLRQRICRLRRHLRAQYLVPLLALLALGGSAWVDASQRDAANARRLSPAVQPFVGRWRVDGVVGGDNSLVGSIVELGPNGATLRTPEGVRFKHFELEQRADELHLASGERSWRVSLERLSPERVRIHGPQGNVTLRRLP